MISGSPVRESPGDWEGGWVEVAGATLPARCCTASWFSPRIFSSEKSPLAALPFVLTPNPGGKEVSDIPKEEA